MPPLFQAARRRRIVAPHLGLLLLAAFLSPHSALAARKVSAPKEVPAFASASWVVGPQRIQGFLGEGVSVLRGAVRGVFEDPQVCTESRKGLKTCVAMASGISTRLSHQASAVLTSPPAVTVGMLAMTVVLGLVSRAADIIDLIVVLPGLLKLQFQYIMFPLEVQYQVFLLMHLERARRVECRRVARARRQGRLDPVSNLPHVDTLAKSKRKPEAMAKDTPVVKDLVMIGGGHAHAYVLKNLGMDPMPGVQATLITRDVETPYSGMLPGHVAGFYTREECHIDLGKLANFGGVRLVHAEAIGIDREKKVVKMKGRPDIPYDVLSINIGSAPQLAQMERDGKAEKGGVATKAATVTPVKPIDGFSGKWETILKRVCDLATNLSTPAGGTAGNPPASASPATPAGASSVQEGLVSPDVARAKTPSVRGDSDASSPVPRASISSPSRGNKIAPSPDIASSPDVAPTPSKSSSDLPPTTKPPPTLADSVAPTPDMPRKKSSISHDSVSSPIRRSSTVPETVDLVVVGGGAGGVELALSMHARLQRELVARGAPVRTVRVSLVSRSATLMPLHSPAARAAFARILGERGITVHLGKEVERAWGRSLVCSDGSFIACDECIWCTSAGAQGWLKETGLTLDSAGFVLVQPTLESVNSPDVFAVGDICSIVGHPRPKAGVFAVRGGPPLARNIRRKLLEGNATRLEDWIPQESFLGIIGTGQTSECVASRGGLGLEGAWLWELKDWIDRTWMAGYTTRLPIMAPPTEALPQVARAAGAEALETLSHAAMRCGGCGAKVGATSLSRVLAKLREQAPFADDAKNGVIVGLDSPDDCAVVLPDPEGRASIHTVDFFRSFVKDPYIFGKIAANHALSDCFAMNALPKTALAIAVVPFGIESKVEDSLFQMMAGACSVLAEAGCSLVGGHTCEGPELSLGFSVNGLVKWPEEGMRKGGMKEGDMLILTKPIGTGTIFAADMRGKARGTWVAAALDSMCLSNQKAGALLKEHGATSCTDVTGFGLLGHLIEMASASHASVFLNLDGVPTLPGATDLVKAGIFSSLQPANLRLRHAVVNEAEAVSHPAYPLIYDPQTSGGLVASVPQGKALTAVVALRKAGYPEACVIGQVSEVRKDGKGSVICGAVQPDLFRSTSSAVK